MKKYKNENLIAGIALAGILLLFGGFFFSGNSTTMILLAVIVAVAGVLAALPLQNWEHIKKLWVSNKKRVCAVSALVCVILCAPILIANAAEIGASTSATKILDNDILEYTYSGTIEDGLSTKDAQATVALIENTNNQLKVIAQASTEETVKTGYDATACKDIYTTYAAGPTTVTITIKNPSTTNSVKINSVTVTDGNGSAAVATINYPANNMLAAQDTFTVLLTAAVGAGGITRLVTIDAEQLTNNDLIFIAPHGSYTVTTSDSDNETVSVAAGETTESIPFPVGTVVTLPTAAAVDNHIFYGWRLSNGQLLADGGEFTVSADVTVAPIYLPVDQFSLESSTGKFMYKNSYGTNSYGPFKVGDMQYLFWNDAMNAAKSTASSVILVEDYTMPNTAINNGLVVGTLYTSFSYAEDGVTVNSVSYSIPSDVTLVLPYAAGATTVADSTYLDDTGNKASTYIYANATFTSANYTTVSGVLDFSNAYLTLTVPSSNTINVNSNSKLVIGGTIVSGTSATRGICGATAGAHSNIQLDGILNINSGGILSCCGYVLGDGTINVASSGNVYQPFILLDHHDGHFVAVSETDGTFPFIRYTMNNIQSKIHMVSGAQMYGYIDLFTQATANLKDRHNVVCKKIIGSTTDAECLVKLAASNASLDISYDKNSYVEVSSSATNNTDGYYSKIGRTTLRFSGGASLGYLELGLELAVVGSVSVNSSSTVFPVPYNYVIELTGNESNYSISNSMMLLPGASMTVEEGAVLTAAAGTFMVMDGLRDYSTSSTSVEVGTSWATFHYPSTTDLQSKGTLKSNGTANFIVNGRFIVDSGVAFGGHVQTNGTGTVTMNGTPSATTVIGHSGGNNRSPLVSAAVNKSAGRTERTLEAKLFYANGEITMTTGSTYFGTTNNSYSLDSYKYLVYTSTDGETTSLETQTLGAVINGTWCAVDGHSCDESGICTICSMFKFYGANVTLGNNLNMMFAFPMSARTDWTGYYVEAVRTFSTDSDGNVAADETKTFHSSNWTTNDDYYVVTYTGFAAKEMCDTITLTVRDEAGNAISTPWEDSIRSYSLRILRKTESEYLPQTIVDMLYYGAACQDYFGYGSDDLATNGLTDAQKALASQNIENVAVESPGTAWDSSMLTVKSNIVYSIAFTGLSEDMSVNYFFTGHKNNSVSSQNFLVSELSKNTEGNYYIKIEELVVADAKCPITVTIYSSDGTIHATWTDSLAAYVKRLVDSHSVYTEFYEFSCSAFTYLHNK